MRRLLLLLSIVFLSGGPAGAQALYQDMTPPAFSNFIPFGPDGTPNRPAPGDHMGNQITLNGGATSLLDGAQLYFGLNTNFGQNPNPATDTYTVDLYKNDGPGGAPGTLFNTTSVQGFNPGASLLALNFPFEAVVPSTFTVVVSSTHPTNTAGTLAGVAGLYSAGGSPTVGAGVNTIWYNTNAAATTWTANSTWAVNDGAAANYFTMELDAVAGTLYKGGGATTVTAPVSDRAVVSNNTAVTFAPGGDVAASRSTGPSIGVSGVVVADTSRVTGTGGNLTSDIVSGGGTLNLASGLKALEHSVVTISGGTVRGSISSGGGNTNRATGLWALDSANVAVGGGTFVGTISSGGGGSDTATGLLASGNATVSVTGGTFTGTDSSGGGAHSITGLTAAGNARVSISGGDFTGGDVDLLARDGAAVTLYGTDFNFSYGPVSALAGTITGRLASGQTVDLSFQQSRAGQFVLAPVPEPTALGSLVACGLLLRRRPARRR